VYLEPKPRLIILVSKGHFELGAFRAKRLSHDFGPKNRILNLVHLGPKPRLIILALKNHFEIGAFRAKRLNLDFGPKNRI